MDHHITDHKLSAKEYIFLASMLFGLFFGAGNLIFPVSMGQSAGSAVWPAIAGFCLTAVGLPLLGVAALGISRSDNLFDMASRISPKYSYFFTCLLYLSIGPLFTMPRTATVSFTVGVLPMLPPSWEKPALFVFSALFILVVLFFSLRPSGILTWVGKILNPIFLLFFSILAVTALVNPMSRIADSDPVGTYQTMSFFQGFLDGYNTVDALTALAFGIILIDAIRTLGVVSPGGISAATIKSGVFSSILMVAIYCMLALIGAQSRAVVGLQEDGGQALALIGAHYFGSFGGILLGVIVTFACLKTAIGLVTSCAATFADLFTHTLTYKGYCILFCLFSFGVANMGLGGIIQFSLPLLMFLYPLTITLILLCLTGHWFDYDRRVFVCVTVPTFFVAVLDFLNTLPAAVQDVLHAEVLLAPAKAYLPFYSVSLGWVVPAVIGLAVGLVWRKMKTR